MASRDRGESGTRSSDKIETAIVNLALEEPDLSPRELAVNFTDTKGSFVSEATVYRLLKDHGLITSPAFILMKAADHFANPTTAPNQLWQTDFTYLKVIGWGWFYLSTVLDDFLRYILAYHVGNRRVRYVAGGAAGVRFEPGHGSASATAVER
jgi:putative transposase